MKCPFCAEQIQDKALKCKHCGETIARELNSKNAIETTRKESQTKFWQWVKLHPVISVFAVLFSLVFISSLASQNTTNDSTSKTVSTNNQVIENSFDKRKEALGFSYQIIVDKTPNMTRSGKNFSAVIVPTTIKPTIEQIKQLAEIIRDENASEPFLWLSFYDDQDAASVDVFKIDTDTDSGIAKIDQVQSHLVFQYNKNNASNLNQVNIYPNGLIATKSEDVIRIDYK